jgi:hypothetical protein
LVGGYSGGYRENCRRQEEETKAEDRDDGEADEQDGDEAFRKTTGVSKDEQQLRGRQADREQQQQDDP